MQSNLQKYTQKKIIHFGECAETATDFHGISTETEHEMSEIFVFHGFPLENARAKKCSLSLENPFRITSSGRSHSYAIKSPGGMENIKINEQWYFNWELLSGPKTAEMLRMGVSMTMTNTLMLIKFQSNFLF